MGLSQVFKIEKITPSVSPELKHYLNLVAAFTETCLPCNFHKYRIYSARMQRKQGREQIPAITLEKPRKQIDSSRFVDVMKFRSRHFCEFISLSLYSYTRASTDSSENEAFATICKAWAFALALTAHIPKHHHLEVRRGKLQCFCYTGYMTLA